MDAVVGNGNDCRMPRPLGWLVLGVVVVVGSIASFEIWLRALDPGQATLGTAPRGVKASAEQSVPVIIPLNPSAQHAPGASGGGGFGRLPGLNLPGGGAVVGGALIVPIGASSTSGGQASNAANTSGSKTATGNGGGSAAGHDSAVHGNPSTKPKAPPAAPAPKPKPSNPTPVTPTPPVPT